jgi:acyl-CoA thioester hydrolase
MQKKLSVKLRVRSYELDSYGHVNNATYLQYLEYARVEYMKQFGINFKEELREYRFFVVNASLNFKAPAFLDDELEIAGSIKKIGNTSFTIKQDIYQTGTNALVLDADVTMVFIDTAGKPAAIPDSFREVLKPFLSE